MRPLLAPATSLIIWVWTWSRETMGSASRYSRSYTSLTLLVVVLTSGAFSTTFTSSTLPVSTSMTMFSSTAELTPTWMSLPT